MQIKATTCERLVAEYVAKVPSRCFWLMLKCWMVLAILEWLVSTPLILGGSPWRYSCYLLLHSLGGKFKSLKVDTARHFPALKAKTANVYLAPSPLPKLCSSSKHMLLVLLVHVFCLGKQTGYQFLQVFCIFGSYLRHLV